MFTSARDAEITLEIYRRVPILWLEGSREVNKWRLTFMTMFHMANDSKEFTTSMQAESGNWARQGVNFTRNGERLVPLYEAKLIHQFDNRLACYSKRAPGSQDTELPRLSENEKRDPTRTPIPRYWVPAALVEEKLSADPRRGRPGWSHDWLLGWRDIARSTDERTLIASVLPRVGVGHTVPIMISTMTPELACLLGNLSTYCLDYAVRQSLSGSHLTFTILKQIPVLPPDSYLKPAAWNTSKGSLGNWITVRVLELSYTSHDVSGFARDQGDEGPPFIWDSARRNAIRSELDAAYFHLYGLARDDVDYVMDSFKVVRERDEGTYGEYRTKRVILEIFDAMQDAIVTGAPYVTKLDPPPGAGARHPVLKENFG